MVRLLLVLWSVLIAGVVHAQPVCSATAADTDAALFTRIDQVTRAAWKENPGIPGAAVAVVKDGRLIYTRGIGFADAERRRPVDAATTQFRIGSITKLFTYTAALQLWVEGRLDMDAPINTYLGDIALPDGPGGPVRVRDLFTHRAGFEEGGLGYSFMADAGRVPSARDFVTHHRLGLVHPAGSVTVYSNFGVSVLGHIVERLRDAPFTQVVEAQIFRPLGMRATNLTETVDPAHMAIGYAPWFGTLRPFPNEHIYPAAAPAGSGFSTAPDMACFMIAVLGEGPSPIDPHIRAAFGQRPYRDRPMLADYGHGFLTDRLGTLVTLSHTGAMGGFRSKLLMVPSERLGIFVAVNSASGNGFTNSLPSRIVEAIFPEPGKPIPAKRANGDFRARWTPLQGHYLTEQRSWHRAEKFLAIGTEVAVAIDPGGFLLVSKGSGKPVRYTEIAPRLFASGHQRAWFEGDGAVRLYLDSKSYARIGWIDRALTMEIARGLSGVAASILLIAAIRRRARVPVLAAAISLLVVWLIGHALADAAGRGEFLVYDWPTTAFILLRWSTIGAALLAIAALVKHRKFALLHAVCLVPLLVLLVHWNLFAPSAN